MAPGRRYSYQILLLVVVLIACISMGFAGYNIFFGSQGISHSLAHQLLSQGLPFLNGEQAGHPGWNYTLRSFFYSLTNFDLGNPRTVIDGSLSILASIKRHQGWSERAFVFIPELELESEQNQTHPKEQIVVEPVIEIEKQEFLPRVLIYHTHTSEMYLGAQASKSLHNSHYVFSSNHDSAITGVMEVGHHLENALNRMGISTIQDTTIHDFPSLAYSYTNSEKTVREILNRHSSIEFVFDIHRDADVPEPIVMINGRRVARLLLVLGTAQDIPLAHPNWQQNLSFAQELQRIAEEMYPGLMRPMQVRRDARYNQHLHTNAVVLEVGSVENTLEEALLAVELFANVLNEFINQRR